MTDEKAKQQAELDALASEAKSQDYIPASDDLTEPQAKKPRMEIGEAMSAVVMVAFNLIAARRGEHWALKPVEAQELGGALGDVINEYFPGVNVGPLPVLCGVAAVVIVPRVMLDQQLAEKEDGGVGDKPEHATSEP